MHSAARWRRTAFRCRWRSSGIRRSKQVYL